jgi:magnesium transporter
MFSTPELTIAYIKKRPESAGRVLASLQPGEAAAFLQAIPTRFAVHAMAKMNPWPASLVIQQMGATSGAALLRDMGFAEASMILRLIDPAGRSQFLAEIPRRLRRDLEMSLAFPTGTVGAHMTTAVATLAESDEVSVALDFIKQAERDHTDVVFVADRIRKLVGAVTVATLLRHPARTALADLLDRSCVALSAYTRLDMIASLDAWHDYNHLPVVNRRGELIGVVSRKALRRSDLGGMADSASSMPSLIESMAEVLSASVIGLVDLLASPSGSPDGRGGVHER